MDQRTVAGAIAGRESWAWEAGIPTWGVLHTRHNFLLSFLTLLLYELLREDGRAKQSFQTCKIRTDRRAEGAGTVCFPHGKEAAEPVSVRVASHPKCKGKKFLCNQTWKTLNLPTFENMLVLRSPSSKYFHLVGLAHHLFPVHGYNTEKRNQDLANVKGRGNSVFIMKTCRAALLTITAVSPKESQIMLQKQIRDP